MADYATTTQIKAFAQQPDSLESVNSWPLLATAASRFFDNLTEVADDFYAAAGASYTNRTFIGDGTAYLKLDPYTALNVVNPVLINDGTILEDLFTDDNVPEYVAKDGMLIVLSKTAQNFGNYRSSNPYTGWPGGRQIKVSAKWGFAAIPSDVTYAVIQIALYMFRSGDPATAVLSNTDKVITSELPILVTETVKRYREQYSRVFVFA